MLFAISLTVVAALPVAASSPGEKEVVPEQSASVRLTGDLVNKKTIRVIYDPETGKIISTPFRGSEALSDPLAKALTRATDGLRVFELSNDGKGVHLDGRFQHALMVRARPDGSLETVCTNHPRAAEEFLRADPSGADSEAGEK